MLLYCSEKHTEEVVVGGWAHKNLNSTETSPHWHFQLSKMTLSFLLTKSFELSKNDHKNINHTLKLPGEDIEVKSNQTFCSYESFASAVYIVLCSNYIMHCNKGKLLVEITNQSIWRFKLFSLVRFNEALTKVLQCSAFIPIPVLLFLPVLFFSVTLCCHYSSISSQ